MEESSVLLDRLKVGSAERPRLPRTVLTRACPLPPPPSPSGPAP